MPDQARIQQAREYAAAYEQRLIDDIRAGLKCNDPEDWIIELEQSIHETLAGKHDNNFAIWQRMNYFLTGECQPLLAW